MFLQKPMINKIIQLNLVEKPPFNIKSKKNLKLF